MVYIGWDIYLLSSKEQSRMADLYDVDGTCPVCGANMTITRLHCEHCGSTLEGSFHLSSTAAGGDDAKATEEIRYGRLARLDTAQLEFVEAFLRCRGVIKNVEDMLGISYPTVKARLVNVLTAMGFAADDEQNDPAWRRTRHEILADLSAGRITTEEAHQQLMRQDK
jgi:hypothetical protein